MPVLALHRAVPRLLAPTALIAVLIIAAPLPAAAFSGAWTNPVRVFAHTGAPYHSMVVDGNGKVHIATERGSSGIWYVTNAGGSWTQCEVSSGDDRQPSIVVGAGGVVGIAFARLTDGQEGLYTVSSDQPDVGGCGWAETLRYGGNVTHTAAALYDGSLSIAFRTSDRKLRFTKGAPSAPAWTVLEVIDGSCCTSGVDLGLTHTGSARVAYGDGTANKAQGMKYGVRTGSGWQRSKAFDGRVKHVAMALDLTPGLFAWDAPSSAPKLVFVVKGRGLWSASKGSSGTGGTWTRRSMGSFSTPPDITTWSNVTRTVFGRGGDLWLEYRTATPFTSKISGNGSHGKPRISGEYMTFTQGDGASGIYYTRAK